MALVWLEEQSASWECDLYVHLARGFSVRNFDGPVPIRVTKSAVAWFMQAPHDLRPIQSIRWAQIRALGGTPRLARLLASATMLANGTTAEEFWESVIRFLIAQDSLSDVEAVDIVEFIDRQRFQLVQATSND